MFSSKIPKNPDLQKQIPFHYQILTKYTAIFITLRSGVQVPLSLLLQKAPDFQGLFIFSKSMGVNPNN